jgi:hypothetical protein
MAESMTQALKKTRNPKKRLRLSEKILIRAEKGNLSIRKTAAKYSVSTETVQRLWGDVKLAEMSKEVATVKEHLADRLYVTADNCVDQVQAALFDASSKDAAVALGILIEKARLLENESTANVDVLGFMGLVNATPVAESLSD